MVEDYGHVNRCDNTHSLEKIFNDTIEQTSKKSTIVQYRIYICIVSC
jgi:hypothetical protein